MTIINSIFSISINLIFLIISTNNEIRTNEIQDINLIKKNDCGVENVILKTERVEKKRKFLFWTLRHKKVIVTDRILDLNGNKILEKKSIFICSMDACDTRKFNHIKIMENEIWVFNHGKNYQQDRIIKKYNFCGKFIGIKDWEIGDNYQN